MKNILCILFAFFFVANISAQKTASTTPEKQLEIATKTLQQFEEKTDSFEEAMELGDSKKIKAVKLMIQQTMEREIAKTQNNKPSANKNTRSSSRAESGKIYLENKRAKAASTNVKTTGVEEKQIDIYQKIAAINNVDEKNSVRLHKLMLEFYDTMETDLEEKKAKLK